jgi:hypothetical protein
MNSARPSVTNATTVSAPATPHSSASSGGEGRLSTTTTPATAPGTLPTASQSETPRSTVPLRRCCHPPTVFVSAP